MYYSRFFVTININDRRINLSNILYASVRCKGDSIIVDRVRTASNVKQFPLLIFVNYFAAWLLRLSMQPCNVMVYDITSYGRCTQNV